MTAGSSNPLTLGSVAWPDPDTIVLRSRTLHPLADATNLSRFRDEVWFTTPADVDNSRAAPSVNLARYPRRLRAAFKAFGLAVLDHPRPAALLVGSPGEQASLATFAGWMMALRVFAEWLDAQQVARICDVTARDLDRYRTHVAALPLSNNRKADYLHAVRALWAYREHLPVSCRLPEARPWGLATARHLAGDTGWSRYNKTPRIHPDTMEALLAWALRMLEDLGPDVRGAFLEDRQLMDGTHPTSRFYRERYFGRALVERLEHLLPQLRAAGRPLPGQQREDGTIEIALSHLARLVACDATNLYRQAATVTRMAQTHGVAVAPDAQLGTITGRIHGVPWRAQPIGLTEIDKLVRLLRAACFVTICYLSGMRSGEVLRLRRGCRRQDHNGQLSLTGYASKGFDHRRADDGQRSWAVVDVVGTAVTMLESLTDSPLLFPPSVRRRSPRPIVRGRPRRNAEINADIAAFIAWVNDTFTPPDGHPPIPPDPTKPVHASRFRRTLAYFVVRRPGGLIAAALQYGHVRTKVTLGYAGEADTSWLDDLTVERLELVVDQLDDDLQHLDGGEHVSGPSADEYRRRVRQAAPFAGRVVDTVRNLERLLASADPNIHHGQGMTCVYRAETALCRSARLQAGLDTAHGPHEEECRSACTNLAYTDRDIDLLRTQLAALDAGAADPLSPKPLRDRVATQAAQVRCIINRHEHGHPAAEAKPDGGA